MNGYSETYKKEWSNEYVKWGSATIFIRKMKIKSTTYIYFPGTLLAETKAWWSLELVGCGRRGHTRAGGNGSWCPRSGTWGAVPSQSWTQGCLGPKGRPMDAGRRVECSQDGCSLSKEVKNRVPVNSRTGKSAAKFLLSGITKAVKRNWLKN